MRVSIGIGLPSTIPGVPGELLFEWARHAEAGPFTSLGVIGRLVYPNYEPLITLTAIPAACELRQSKYLNNLVEQDHRFIKRLVKPGMGFFSFETAWRTLQGYEVINMVRKGQMQGVRKGDSLRQAAFLAELFGVAI